MFVQREVVRACQVLIAATGLIVAHGTASAQQAINDASSTAAGDKLERVTVTGSNIRRTDAETPSPVQVLTAEDLKKSGYTSVQDVLHTLTANNQGTLSQGFASAFASGAGGIALRGLTVGATLVLIDGHRMAPYPIGDDGQRSFVDISNIPFDAVERIEVLKDGASAVYGSDAIAGVVNIILKRSFTGLTLAADTGLSGKGDGGTHHIAGTWGIGDLESDGHNFFVSAEARKQNQIRFADRGGLFTQTDFTSAGGIDTTAGVPNSANGGLARSPTGYVTDADGNIAGFMPGCDATKYAAGQCTYKNNWSQIQPATENYNLVARYTQKLQDDWQVSVQGSYFEGKAQQVGGPSRAFSGGYQGITSGPGVTPTLLDALGPTTISASNPSFPAGTGLSQGLLRYTFLDVGPQVTDTTSKATRLIADLQGSYAGWDLAASVGYTEVRLDLVGTGSVQAGLLQQALDNPTDPYVVGGPNSASTLAFIAPALRTKDTSKLSFLHLGGSRELMSLPGGPLQMAIGTDYYHRSQDATAPADVAAGLTDAFSNNYTIGKQNVVSAYGELVAPVTKEIETEAALRWDHYNISGGRASPKVGFKYTPIKEFALRGTFSRGFRAPSPAENGTAGQTFFASTINDPILCTDGTTTTPGNFPSQCQVSPGTVQSTTKSLKPETSRSFTLGVIVEPLKDLSASIDFYSINLKDQIVAGGVGDTVRGTNLTPIEQVQPDGSTALVTPPVAPIAYLTTGYINANSTKTSGVDVDLQYKHRFEGIADFKTDLTWSFVKKYDLTVDGVTYQLAGTHGPFIISGATGTPRSRIQWANTASQGPWSVTGTVNYISSFSLSDPSFGINDCIGALKQGVGAVPFGDELTAGNIPPGVSCRVKKFTTFDLTGHYDVTKQLQLSAAVLNLFKQTSPADWLTYGGGTAPYNPSFHQQGAIGQYFTVGARYTF